MIRAVSVGQEKKSQKKINQTRLKIKLPNQNLSTEIDLFKAAIGLIDKNTGRIYIVDWLFFLYLKKNHSYLFLLLLVWKENYKLKMDFHFYLLTGSFVIYNRLHWSLPVLIN